MLKMCSDYERAFRFRGNQIYAYDGTHNRCQGKKQGFEAWLVDQRYSYQSLKNGKTAVAGMVYAVMVCHGSLRSRDLSQKPCVETWNQ